MKIRGSVPIIQLVVVQSLCRVWLCDPMNCSTPGFPVLHCLLELAQTHVCWVGDAIQPSHPLSSPSPPALNLSQHQGLFQWVSSSHQVAKVLELFQHQSFQQIFRVGFYDFWYYKTEFFKDILGIFFFWGSLKPLSEGLWSQNHFIIIWKHFSLLSSSRVWMWELNHKESWAPKN